MAGGRRRLAWPSGGFRPADPGADPLGGPREALASPFPPASGAPPARPWARGSYQPGQPCSLWARGNASKRHVNTSVQRGEPLKPSRAEILWNTGFNL